MSELKAVQFKHQKFKSVCAITFLNVMNCKMYVYKEIKMMLMIMIVMMMMTMMMKSILT